MDFNVFLLLAAVFSTALAVDDILVFTDSNFEAEVGKHDIILVKFYAPW